jgi:hypothetical protein
MTLSQYLKTKTPNRCPRTRSRPEVLKKMESLIDDYVEAWIADFKKYLEAK